MTNDKMTPKIRFRGFSDPWEQRKLGDIGERFTYGLNASSKEYDGKHKYLRITDIDDATHAFIQNNLTSPNINFKNYHDYVLNPGDIVFARTGASTGKTFLYRETKDIVYYAGFLIRLTVKPSINSEFIFQNTLTTSFTKFVRVMSQRSGQPGINSKEYAKYKLCIPEMKEQIRIGLLLRKTDRFIAANEDKLNQLKELKKLMMQKIFSQAWRFKGFTDPWEQRQFSKIYSKNNERNNGQFDSNKTISIANMYFKKEGNEAAVKSINSYKVLRVGDIAFEGHTSKKFSYGRMVMNDLGDGIMSPRFTTLRPKKKQVISFWKILIHYEPVMKYILVKSTKKGTMMNELVLSDFLKNEISIPVQSEQEHIGGIFQLIDSLIAANEEKLEQLKQLKKYLMQNMFV